jgi:hypothetical protein
VRPGLYDMDSPGLTEAGYRKETNQHDCA